MVNLDAFNIATGLTSASLSGKVRRLICLLISCNFLAHEVDTLARWRLTSIDFIGCRSNGIYAWIVGCDILLILIDPSLLCLYLPRSPIRRIAGSTRWPLMLEECLGSLPLESQVCHIALFIFLVPLREFPRVLFHSKFLRSWRHYDEGFTCTFVFSAVSSLSWCVLRFIKRHCLGCIAISCERSATLRGDCAFRYLTEKSKRIFCFYLDGGTLFCHRSIPLNGFWISGALAQHCNAFDHLLCLIKTTFYYN